MSELRKIWFKGKRFYVDNKLQELRNVENPHEVFTFDEYCDIRKQQRLSWGIVLDEGVGCGTCLIHGGCEL